LKSKFVPSKTHKTIDDYVKDLYEWEGIFSFVGFLETSLVEQIFEDKDFD